MSSRVTDPRPSTATAERELLGRLGLGPGASNDQVEAAHDEILDFLRRAPGSLREWARAEVAAVDEAYAVLNGGVPSAPAPSSRPATAHPAAAATHVATGGIDDQEDWPDEIDQPIVTRRESRRARPEARRAAVASNGSSITISQRSLVRAGMAGGAVVAAAILIFAVFKLGESTVPGLTGTPAPQSSSGIDLAAVNADMQKIAANPKDTATLQDLANLYYASGDYATAQTWLQKLLDVDPKNTPALLGYGAAAFNLGDLAAAEAKWRAVLAIDPKNVEAHYDLGFMYFSQDPPNLDQVRNEWNQVIALDPTSDIAKTVKTHLDSLNASASSSPGAATSVPSGSAAPASPGASPGTSPAPAPSPAAS